MVGVGLKVVLFSSDEFTLQATNADKSLRVAFADAHRYSEESPPDLGLPDPSQLPLDPNPAIAIGTGTLVEYRFPQGPDGGPGIPELYLRDVKDGCFAGTTPDFSDAITDAAKADIYPSRLAALIASHLRRFSYLGSTVARREFSRLTIEVTVKGSGVSPGRSRRPGRRAQRGHIRGRADISHGGPTRCRGPRLLSR